MIKIKELRQKAGMTQQKFADYFHISKRTVESWEQNEGTINKRSCPEYMVDLIEYKLRSEGFIKCDQPK